MIAFFLSFLAKVFDEIGTSIGKHKVQLSKESIYTMGFLNMFWGALFFLSFAFFIRKAFVFSFESLPTFIPRLVLEVAQTHVTLNAIVAASRSTFSFIRIFTIPLLLLIDIILGYSITTNQIAGVVLTILALVILLINHGLNTKGSGLVIFTTLNAVITISLFKYNITNFNSVEAEQSLVTLTLMVYLFVMAFKVAKENPLKFLLQPVFLFQSLTTGAGSVLISFAYNFAPASVITALKRSLSVLMAVISGHYYFKEKNLVLKLVAFVIIMIGLTLLVF